MGMMSGILGCWNFWIELLHATLSAAQDFSTSFLHGLSFGFASFSSPIRAPSVAVLSSCLGPLGTGSRHCFGIVLASAMEPRSAVERARAANRAGTDLAPTRVVRKATIDSRKRLLEDFRCWLWETEGVSLTTLLTLKPPDAEEICRWLVAYGQAMFLTGQAYGKFAETIN